MPSEASPHQVGQSDGHSFNVLPKTPREGRVLNLSAVPQTPALLRETLLGGFSSWWGLEGGDRAV